MYSSHLLIAAKQNCRVGDGIIRFHCNWYSIQNGALQAVRRTAIVCLPTNCWCSYDIYNEHPLNMPMTTLLAAVVALYLQDTLVRGVTLEAENRDGRDVWGENDILLICRDGEGELANAIFTRNGASISASPCSPGGDNTYCTEEGGARLRFTASNVTEGYFACKNYADETSDEIAIIGKRVLTILVTFYMLWGSDFGYKPISKFHAAYPAVVFSETEVIGVWGMDLVLPCRYAPGPLANDSNNFYQHTWSSCLDEMSNSINLQESNSDFTLTLVKLNPILAMYDYQCGIEFKPVPSQPYNLRDSPADVGVIDVMINETDG